MIVDESKIEKLELQVAEAKAQLEQYQALLNEFPGIYEDKFRQAVHALAEEIRQLVEERKALQEQVSRVLIHSRQPQALPPAAPYSPTVSRPALRRWADVCLPRFQSLSASVPSPSPSSASSLPRLSRLASHVSPPKGSQIRAFFGAGIALALLVLGLPYLLNRNVLPSVGNPTVSRGRGVLPLPMSASLRLEARGGQSWVLVERLGGGKVVDAILEPGQSKVLPLGSGLKIRSGRPDLLYIGVGSARPVPLGGVSDLDWFEFVP